MSIFIDRRNKKSSVQENKKKFLQRYKRALKESVDNQIKHANIKDLKKKDRKVSLKRKHIKEPFFTYDKKSKGKSRVVGIGNKKFNVGDEIPKPSSQSSGRGGDGSGNEELEDFVFTLTKEEFLDLFFEGLKLPNLVKKSLKGSNKFIIKRKGFSNEGTPSRIDYNKTFENALARKLIFKKKKTPFIDDIDIKYKYYDKYPKPVHKAFMFCIMDVSGSMQELHKLIAKKFYLLIYLFLDKMYDNVEFVFIRYHHEAQECTEDEFFYSRETGGTVVSRALNLTHKLIKEKCNLSTDNIYCAQASDGDNFSSYDDNLCVEILRDKILPIVQYYMYLEIRPQFENFSAYFESLQPLFHSYENIKGGFVHKEENIYPAFREFFKSNEQ